MAKVGILSCEKIRDIHCMGCIKCYKAADEKLGGFAQHDDDVNIVFWAGCGGCPGLYMPKMTILNEMADKLGREYDVVHIGTCIQKAVNTAGCPIDLEQMKQRIEGKWGKKVILGTHPW